MRDFEADRRICDAATPGKWGACIGSGFCVCTGINSIVDGKLIFIADTLPDYAVKGEVKAEKDHRGNLNFIIAARDGWPKALDRIAELEKMLKFAAREAAKGCCPYDVAGADAVKEFCNDNCEVDDDKPPRCWIEYWGKLRKDGK